MPKVKIDGKEIEAATKEELELAIKAFGGAKGTEKPSSEPSSGPKTFEEYLGMNPTSQPGVKNNTDAEKKGAEESLSDETENLKRFLSLVSKDPKAAMKKMVQEAYGFDPGEERETNRFLANKILGALNLNTFQQVARGKYKGIDFGDPRVVERLLAVASAKHKGMVSLDAAEKELEALVSNKFINGELVVEEKKSTEKGSAEEPAKPVLTFPQMEALEDSSGSAEGISEEDFIAKLDSMPLDKAEEALAQLSAQAAKEGVG